LERLSKRLKTLQETSKDSPKPILIFDKDDVDTLDFVTASANLRATIFGIEPKSKFDTKRKLDAIIDIFLVLIVVSEMAGNIIPAIATTNAMTAGLCVLQAFKVLKDDFQNAKMVRATFDLILRVNLTPLPTRSSLNALERAPSTLIP
jgi:ubiquitin-like 1-activating enzyme E1 B